MRGRRTVRERMEDSTMTAPADTPPHRSGETDFSPLLAPKSIAVIGASDDPRKLSGRPIAYMKKFGYAGHIYPVNPTRDVVQGLPSYADVRDIEGDVDVAVLVSPAGLVLDAVRGCVAKGVRFALITASGFAEASADGAALEQELRQLVAGSDIRLIGPNCLGMIGVRDAAVPTFASVFEADNPLRPGGVAFVSQSGAFGTFILGDLQASAIGMSHYFNTGNELDVTVGEVLSGLVQDEDIHTLLAYFEGVSRGEQLLEVAREAHRRDKAILAVKSGRSEAGARAASSHTASMTGDDKVFEQLMREVGVIRVRSQEQLQDAAQVFDARRKPRGRRLTVLSMSGGGAVMAADTASDFGLEVAPWAPEWQERLASRIPAFASPRNPVDLTGSMITDPSLLRAALTTAIEYPDTDMIVIVLGNADGFADPVIEAVSELYGTTDRPIVFSWTGGTGEPRQRLRELGIPCFTDPTRAVGALGALADHALRRELPRPERPAGIDERAARSVIEAVRADGRRTLDEAEATALVNAYGIPTSPSAIAASAAEAAAAAASLGGKVVVKLLSNKIMHKSDVGGVRLGLATPEEVERAAEEILEVGRRHGEPDPRVLVQQMATGDVELILGAQVDPAFGPVVVAGLGGVFVEVLADTRIASAPTDTTHVEHLLDSLQGAALLHGVRGRPAVDTAAAAAAAERLSWLIADLRDEIAEVDINPVLVRESGATAVDALIVLR
ncbi:acetate--CoA ligase family protein [Streptomyces mutabilis]|uniref:acetate--CoA ligase family protein n=1 Tax=Streptomyces mutabilis TaxID=67332 RepID=UPI00364A970A